LRAHGTAAGDAKEAVKKPAAQHRSSCTTEMHSLVRYERFEGLSILV
jgi:hypothetical protein